MAFCPQCGCQIEDNQDFCPRCGFQINKTTGKKKSNLLEIAYIFCIIGCVAGGLSLLIPLAWCIPMTIEVNEYRQGRRAELSIGFKICVLLFVNVVAGILLLCDDDR